MGQRGATTLSIMTLRIDVLSAANKPFYPEWHYAECHCAECRVTFVVSAPDCSGRSDLILNYQIPYD